MTHDIRHKHTGHRTQDTGCKTHLCAWNVLLWVLQVSEQRICAPGDALVDVGLRVGEAGGLAGLAANQAV